MNYMILTEPTYRELIDQVGAYRVIQRLDFVAFEMQESPGMFYIVKNRYSGQNGKVNENTLKSLIRILEEQHAKSRNQTRTGS